MIRSSIFAAARTTALFAVLRNEATDGTTGSVGGTAAPEVKLTRDEKFAKTIDVLEKRIAADTAKLAEVKLERETAAKLSSVTTGTAVVARIGRAETAKNVNARVVGVKEEESGATRYKIIFGEGVDTDVAVIQPSQIVEVIVETTPTLG